MTRDSSPSKHKYPFKPNSVVYSHILHHDTKACFNRYKCLFYNKLQATSFSESFVILSKQLSYYFRIRNSCIFANIFRGLGKQGFCVYLILTSTYGVSSVMHYVISSPRCKPSTQIGICMPKCNQKCLLVYNKCSISCFANYHARYEALVCN